MMNAYAILLPLLLPIIGAVFLLVFARSVWAQRIGGVVFSGLTLIASLYLVWVVDTAGYIVLQSGGWAAPFGISLVADRFSAIMVAVSAFMGFTVAWYAVGEIDTGRLKRYFFPLYLMLLFGVNGAFLTGDLFNLYVWFEVMLIASFILMAIGGKRDELEGAIKYVSLNLLASMFFLIGAGMIYGITGTLNMADISAKVAAAPDAESILPAALLLFVAFAVKAALFPFFFWLPASYHTPPPAVSAIFAGLLTKVGVYALFRFHTLLFVSLFSHFQTLLIVLSVFTMVTGVLGAASHFQMRRILSFHIISQIGYMTVALAIMTPLALASGIFYLVHHIIVKTNLFLISGVVVEMKGTDDLARVGGLSKSAPWLAFLFFVPAFSLGGIPPLSGFWAKFGVVKASLEAGHWWVVTFALLVGVLTLFSMTKIWAEAFWKKEPEAVSENENGIEVDPSEDRGGIRPLRWMLPPIASMAVATVVIGLFGEPMFQYTDRAANQLLDADGYRAAVLLQVDALTPPTQIIDASAKGGN
ncbi:MAG: Na+/H+ antiporter subunit D [Verrucomicrobia bacterium]|jgi:multicomponent Na+:H+ antiporter subunit D|nr:Na+/H+ antiporter subunit D [Verrucomicrobiota bacterium]